MQARHPPLWDLLSKLRPAGDPVSPTATRLYYMSPWCDSHRDWWVLRRCRCLALRNQIGWYDDGAPRKMGRVVPIVLKGNSDVGGLVRVALRRLSEWLRDGWEYFASAPRLTARQAVRALRESASTTVHVTLEGRVDLLPSMKPCGIWKMVAVPVAADPSPGDLRAGRAACVDALLHRAGAGVGASARECASADAMRVARDLSPDSPAGLHPFLAASAARVLQCVQVVQVGEDLDDFPDWVGRAGAGLHPLGDRTWLLPWPDGSATVHDGASVARWVYPVQGAEAAQWAAGAQEAFLALGSMLPRGVDRAEVGQRLNRAKAQRMAECRTLLERIGQVPTGAARWGRG